MSEEEQGSQQQTKIQARRVAKPRTTGTRGRAARPSTAKPAVAKPAAEPMPPPQPETPPMPVAEPMPPPPAPVAEAPAPQPVPQPETPPMPTPTADFVPQPQPEYAPPTDATPQEARRWQNRKNKWERRNQNRQQQQQPQPPPPDALPPDTPPLYLKELEGAPFEQLVALLPQDQAEDAINMRRHEVIMAIIRSWLRRRGTVIATGCIEVLNDCGFLRSAANDYIQCPEDVYVSQQQIRRHGLRSASSTVSPWSRPSASPTSSTSRPSSPTAASCWRPRRPSSPPA